MIPWKEATNPDKPIQIGLCREPLESPITIEVTTRSNRAARPSAAARSFLDCRQIPGSPPCCFHHSPPVVVQAAWRETFALGRIVPPAKLQGRGGVWCGVEVRGL